MLRRIFYRGESIIEDSLVVGNHGNAHVSIDGNFLINGLIYCPKQILRINIKGSGKITLRGVCKELEVRADGECLLDFTDLKVTILHCRALSGKSTLMIGSVRAIMEKNIGEQAMLITNSQRLANDEPVRQVINHRSEVIV